MVQCRGCGTGGAALQAGGVQRPQPLVALHCPMGCAKRHYLCHPRRSDHALPEAAALRLGRDLAAGLQVGGRAASCGSAIPPWVLPFACSCHAGAGPRMRTSIVSQPPLLMLGSQPA